MSRATDAAADNSRTRIVCECGSDHRGIRNQHCPIFNILSRLHDKIQVFLDAQEVLESGKDGPMAYCLRYTMLVIHDLTSEEIRKWEAKSKENPEWQLAAEISKLKRYFEQVADGCAKDEKSLGLRPPSPVLPEYPGDMGSAQRRAHVSIHDFYDTCHRVIEEFVRNGAKSLSRQPDHQGHLALVDNAYKETFETVLLVGDTNHRTIQHLNKKSYDIWAECRRLLCEFRRPFRGVTPFLEP